MKLAIKILVILTVLIAGVYYLWAKTSYLDPIKPRVFELCCAPDLDETADWKVYRNDEWGFSIKYPKDFIIDILDTKKSEEFTFASLVQILNPKDKGEFVPAFQVGVGRQPYRFNGKVYGNIKDYLDDLFSDSADPFRPKETVSVSSVNGNLEALMVSTKDEILSYKNNVIYVMKDGYVYSILASDAYPEFKKIANSFKFTK
ncbi:MAG: PsbP-related protein [Patescibacteria group bacterium]